MHFHFLGFAYGWGTECFDKGCDDQLVLQQLSLLDTCLCKQGAGLKTLTEQVFSQCARGCLCESYPHGTLAFTPAINYHWWYLGCVDCLLTANQSLEEEVMCVYTVLIRVTISDFCLRQIGLFIAADVIVVPFFYDKTVTTEIFTLTCVSLFVQTMVSAALLYRQTKADHYQAEGDSAAQMPEYIPWTATSGPTGLRTILSKQVRGLELPVGSCVWVRWYVRKEGV